MKQQRLKMAFMLYTDKKMRNPANTRLTFNGVGNLDVVLYFGSSQSDEVLSPETDAQIILKPVNLIKKWQPNKYYDYGNIIEPSNPNGYIYQCITPGRTGSKEPRWWVDYISGVSGSAWFKVLGEAFRHTDIKISLTQAGLDSAVGGEGIELGDQLQGGRAIPIYMRVVNKSYSLRNDFTDACRGLATNSTITTTTNVYAD
ncbi:hypothetical protein BHC59_11930 [Snodgrassella alvi]|jgi:hypothetical protein|uniref:Uncharacterized protein n=4 Tax=Snodgrassella alvi TaxID=1196083 RepID=A0A855FMG2_9NEIS|nr:hypothetical protein BHC59_11930 [Snodgrassella alvi]PIT58722.1 hypothetical protein BHC57_11445 [Snodgrassella alvi]